jgi:hypothetical protein
MEQVKRLRACSLKLRRFTVVYGGDTLLLRPSCGQTARTSLALPRLQAGRTIKANGGRMKAEFRTQISALCILHSALKCPGPTAIQPMPIAASTSQYK